MQLNILESAADSLRVGYQCPCGCQPNVTYRQGGPAAHDGCCCGNEFVIGLEREARFAPLPGFHAEEQTVSAPWGDSLRAAWLIGPSTHEEAEMHEHDAHHHELPVMHGTATESATDSAADPVCGMSVDREAARASGRTSTYKGVEYFFCGKGCKLDFDEDPERYLDPSFTPSM